MQSRFSVVSAGGEEGHQPSSQEGGEGMRVGYSDGWWVRITREGLEYVLLSIYPAYREELWKVLE